MNGVHTESFIILCNKTLAKAPADVITDQGPYSQNILRLKVASNSQI